MTIVKVFMVDGDQNSIALASKVAQAHDCHADIYTCPRTLADMQPMPSIQVDGGERFYGEEGIEAFLAARKRTK